MLAEHASRPTQACAGEADEPQGARMINHSASWVAITVAIGAALLVVFLAQRRR
jgi:hypothetical protein